MTKADPVAWLIRVGPHSVVQLTEPHPSYARMSAPLYTSPDATRIAELEAEATRWREVADKLAQVARSCLDDYGHPSFTDRHGMAGTIRAALTAYRAMESGE